MPRKKPYLLGRHLAETHAMLGIRRFVIYNTTVRSKAKIGTIDQRGTIANGAAEPQFDL
jgi:hypothetical protein